MTIIPKYNISNNANRAIEFSDNIQAWIDEDTCLMWEVKTEVNIEHQYIWSEEYADDIKDAFSYANQLNIHKYAGFDDWRVPTIKELKTIITEKDNNENYIKLALSKNTVKNYYWSSTPVTKNNNLAWYVYFSFGCTYEYDKVHSLHVRCVRYSSKDNFSLFIEI